MSTKAALLLAVDLEDVRHSLPDGLKWKSRVPSMLSRFLHFFKKHRVNATFFTVGNFVQEYSDCIRLIQDAGHEIACHTFNHRPLELYTPESFRHDIRACQSLYAQNGVTAVGFRAPILSLTQKTTWAYDILAEEGFAYSSSVLPAANPLYGYPNHPEEPIKTPQGLWELPISILKTGGLTVPFAAGVYIRALPRWIVKAAGRFHRHRNLPLVGYVHPFDIDVDQERFMHPGIGESIFYNWLMYYNRSSVFKKLEALLSLGLPTCTCKEYVDQLNAGLRSHAAA